MRSILLFALVAAAAAAAADKDAVFYHQQQPQTPTNEELLEKLMRLEDRFEKEMDVAQGTINQLTKLKEEFEKKMADVQDRIVRLEQENEKLTGDFSAAKERIGSLEVEVERLSGRLLLSPSATSINRRHPEAAAESGGVNDLPRTAGDGAKSRAIVSPPPTSCAELAQLGNQITGFYLVTDKESNNRIQTVYCDFALASNNPDYETTIGYLDVKTSSSASFYVQRQTSYSTGGSIPYELTRLNVGGHMNAATGVFTAPVNGRYQFSFTAMSGSSGQNHVFLRVNGTKIAISYAPSIHYKLSLVATLQLTKGDTVDVYLYKGSIYDDSNRDTQFSGFLLEEDLDFPTSTGPVTPADSLSYGNTPVPAAVTGPMPTDCDSAKALGWTHSGFYTVKGSTAQLKTVYCDFSKAKGTTGYETAIGFLGVKTPSSGASFYVQRNSPYSSNGTVIPYQVTRLNIGGHMNAATGVFTAPVNGRYHFSFTALTGRNKEKSPDAAVGLRVNGDTTASSWAPPFDGRARLPLVATLQLTKGDRVDVYLAVGSIFDDQTRHTQFSGILLEEDLVL